MTNKKGTTRKKSSTKKIKKSDNSNITRTFVNGKMIVTFKNGKTREISLEELENRKVIIPKIISNRAKRIKDRKDNLIERINKEEDLNKKEKLEKILVEINKQESNQPTEQELINNLQILIDSVKASV